MTHTPQETKENPYGFLSGVNRVIRDVKEGTTALVKGAADNPLGTSLFLIAATLPTIDGQPHRSSSSTGSSMSSTGASGGSGGNSAASSIAGAAGIVAVICVGACCYGYQFFSRCVPQPSLGMAQPLLDRAERKDIEQGVPQEQQNRSPSNT